MKNPNWSESEKQFLLDNYESLTAENIAKALDRTLSSVRNKAKKLDLTKDRKCYGVEHIQFVKENYQEPNQVLAAELNLSIKTIQRIRKENNIPRPTKRLTYTLEHTRKWDEETVKYITENKHLSNQFLGKELGLDPATIRRIRKMYAIDNPNQERSFTEISSAEIEIKTMLDYLGIIYEQQFPVGRYYVDFVIGNAAIEVQGDYWHGNPEHTTELNQRQERAVKTDWEKKQLLEHLGYHVLWIWESEIDDGRAIRKLRTFLQQLLPPNHVNCGDSLRANQATTELETVNVNAARP